MRLLAAALLFGLVFAQPIQSSAADKTSKAQAVINRAVKALGGIKAVKRTQNSIVDDKGIYHGMGMEIPYEGRFVNSTTKKNGTRMRMEIKNAFLVIFDGKKGYRVAGGFSQEIKGKSLEVMKQQNMLTRATSLVPLAKPNKAYKLTLLKASKVKGVECDVVKVAHKGMPDLTLQ